MSNNMACFEMKSLVTCHINVKLGHVGSLPNCNFKFVKDGHNSSYMATLWTINAQNYIN